MVINILIGLAVLAALGIGGFVWLGQKSKAGEPLGIVDGALAACPDSPNCVVSEAHAADDKRIDALPLTAWEKIPGAVAAAGGNVNQITDDYISATFTSKTFGFVDDVEFRKAGDVAHVRSASRVGYSDRGVNRARIEALRTALAE